MWREVFPSIYKGLPINAEIFEIRAKLSHFPPRTRESHRFETWGTRPELQDSFDKAKAFAKNKSSHHFLTLTGTPGTGKTHLAIAIGWEWLEQEKGTVAYWQVENLLDELRRGYKQEGRSSWTVEDEIHFLKNCSLLIFDDFGAEKETEWSLAKLDEIVDYRYINHFATIFTTNYSFENLPARIADRIQEGVVVRLKAESYRKLKHNRNA